MLYGILSAIETRDVPVSEAALYALLGFAVVFFGIAFLIFVVWLVGKIMSSVQGKAKKAAAPNIAKQELAPVGEDEITEETVAVIMAALTAYYQTSESKCEFTVKRIKRI